MMDCPHSPAPRIMASTVSNLRCSSASLKVNSVVSTCTARRATLLGGNRHEAMAVHNTSLPGAARSQYGEMSARQDVQSHPVSRSETAGCQAQACFDIMCTALTSTCLDLAVLPVAVEAVDDVTRNLRHVHRHLQRPDDAGVAIGQAVLDVVQRRVDEHVGLVPCRRLQGYAQM